MSIFFSKRSCCTYFYPLSNPSALFHNLLWWNPDLNNWRMPSFDSSKVRLLSFPLLYYQSSKRHSKHDPTTKHFTSNSNVCWIRTRWMPIQKQALLVSHSTTSMHREIAFFYFFLSRVGGVFNEALPHASFSRTIYQALAIHFHTLRILLPRTFETKSTCSKTSRK